MSPSQKLPYGRWESPLSAKELSTSSISLHEVVVDDRKGAIYTVECRPAENGRYSIVRHLNGQIEDVLPEKLSAHASVQELGGGSLAIRPDGKIVFAEDETSGVYLLDPASFEATSVHPAIEGVRYADFCFHPKTIQWMIAIKEDHRDATPETQATHVHNSLVAIDVESGKETTIVRGDDFYSHPKFDPSGKYVSWIQWSHPDMPWTGTVLYFAEWDNGLLRNVTRVAGEACYESIAQPKWGLDGLLYFTSDRTGFWQLYSFNADNHGVKSLSFPSLESSDFAIAEWTLGCSTYVPLDERTIVAAVITNATSRIMVIDTLISSCRDLELPYVDLAHSMSGIYRVSSNSFAVVGATATSPQELALVSMTPKGVERTVLTSTASFTFSPDHISTATHMAAPQKYGPQCDGDVHSFYFPPCNPKCEPDNETLPPVLVYVHGGPNGCVTPALNLEIQYYTTRGFAVCAVNYTGSTGFGREYRERLSGYWGIVDTADAVSAVDYLVEKNLVDQSRVGIYGGSAGGYLTLQALHMYPDVWAAAVSSYGISDVRALQADSYKFESQDVDRLLLSKTAPEQREQELTERSPCHHAKMMKAPLLLLQGTIDMVVPVAQARIMADAMLLEGRTAEVVEFQGEGHGWIGQKAVYESLQRKGEWWVKYLTSP